jgi:hypothetical protein
MGVVPEGGGGLVDPPARRPSGAGVDRLVRAAVGRCRQVHAVPVDGGGLWQVVAHMQHDLIAAGGAEGGAKVGAVGVPGGGLAGQQLAGALLQAQVEHFAAGAVGAGLQQRRDLELVGEAELAEVADVGLGPEPGRQPGQPEYVGQPNGLGSSAAGAPAAVGGVGQGDQAAWSLRSGSYWSWCSPWSQEQVQQQGPCGGPWFGVALAGTLRVSGGLEHQPKVRTAGGTGVVNRPGFNPGAITLAPLSPSYGRGCCAGAGGSASTAAVPADGPG